MLWMAAAFAGPITVDSPVRSGSPPRLPAVDAVDHGCRRKTPVDLRAISDVELQRIGYGRTSPIRVMHDGVLLEPHVPRGCKSGSFHRLGWVEFVPVDGPSSGYSLVHDEAIEQVDRRHRVTWVYPGTTLEIPVSGADEADVVVVTEILGRGEATLEVGKQRQPLRQRQRVKGIDVRAVRIRSPKNGPYVLVRAVVVGNVHAIGSPAAAAPRTLGVVGKRVGKVEAAWAEPPIALTMPAMRPGQTDDMGIFDIPELEAISLPVLEEAVGRGCSPLRVTMDGAPLPYQPDATHRFDAMKNRKGRAAHHKGLLIASTPDGSRAAGHTFALALDEDRSCKEMRWLYPHDRVRFAIPAVLLDRMTRGLSQLAVKAYATADTGKLHVRVLQRRAEKLGAALPIAHLSPTGAATMDLSMPVEAGAKDLVVEVDNPGEGYVLLVDLRLLPPETE